MTSNHIQNKTLCATLSAVTLRMLGSICPIVQVSPKEIIYGRNCLSKVTMRGLAASPVVMQRAPTDLSDFAESLLMESGAEGPSQRVRKVRLWASGLDGIMPMQSEQTHSILMVLYTCGYPIQA